MDRWMLPILLSNLGLQILNMSKLCFCSCNLLSVTFLFLALDFFQLFWLLKSHCSLFFLVCNCSFTNSFFILTALLMRSSAHGSISACFYDTLASPAFSRLIGCSALLSQEPFGAPRRATIWSTSLRMQIAVVCIGQMKEASGNLQQKSPYSRRSKDPHSSCPMSVCQNQD